MDFIFTIIGMIPIGLAILLGFEVAGEEEKCISIGILSCICLFFSGAAIAGFSFAFEDITTFLYASIIPIVLLILGAIFYHIWKKGS